MEKITLSVIKADIGGFPGHCSVHEDLLNLAKQELKIAKQNNIILDYHVTACGDDLQLIMSHGNGENNETIHKLAWDTFIKCTNIAKELCLYGAGQDLLSDSFSGNIKGLGPGSAEIEFTVRKSEPIVVFAMDKTEPGAFNLPIFKMFGDPFNTIGLVIDPSSICGYNIEIFDIKEDKKVIMSLPEEMYQVLALIGAQSRYVIKRILPKEEHKLPSNEAIAAISTDKLFKIANKYVGKDDPVAIVRAQSGLPALGEILEPFSFPHLVSGWMRGSHNGPLMPCAVEDAKPTRFDGPPRVIALGFQITSEGKLIGPVDLFKDKSFDNARQKALDIADYMRRHGPFEPHRLSMTEMEYTTLPKVLDKLKDRFKPI